MTLFLVLYNSQKLSLCFFLSPFFGFYALESDPEPHVTEQQQIVSLAVGLCSWGVPGYLLIPDTEMGLGMCLGLNRQVSA